ncbi:MAG: hypothetical protein ACRD3O_13525, partial [Terriglobia bacterium]
MQALTQYVSWLDSRVRARIYEIMIHEYEVDSLSNPLAFAISSPSRQRGKGRLFLIDLHLADWVRRPPGLIPDPAHKHIKWYVDAERRFAIALSTTGLTLGCDGDPARELDRLHKSRLCGKLKWRSFDSRGAEIQWLKAVTHSGSQREFEGWVDTLPERKH